MKKILKWLGIGFIVIIVIGVISSAGKSGTSQKSESTGVTQEKQQVREPTVIKAQELADDFDANQVAAEEKWKGKLVEFSAEISNITETGIAFQNVSSKDFSLTQISCRIKDKGQLLPLKNGQSVTVRGVVGEQTIGVIDVNQCEVID